MQVPDSPQTHKTIEQQISDTDTSDCLPDFIEPSSDEPIIQQTVACPNPDDTINKCVSGVTKFTIANKTVFESSGNSTQQYEISRNHRNTGRMTT
jgi:hypothetical protein